MAAEVSGATSRPPASLITSCRAGHKAGSAWKKEKGTSCLLQKALSGLGVRVLHVNYVESQPWGKNGPRGRQQ